MRIAHTIKAIETLIESLSSQNEIENYQTFSTIKVLATDLKEELASQDTNDAYINEKILEIIIHSRLAAKLDDNGHPISQHISWAQTASNSMANMLEKMGVNSTPAT